MWKADGYGCLIYTPLLERGEAVWILLFFSSDASIVRLLDGISRALFFKVGF